jgi:hypothetical protein
VHVYAIKRNDPRLYPVWQAISKVYGAYNDALALLDKKHILRAYPYGVTVKIDNLLLFVFVKRPGCTSIPSCSLAVPYRVGDHR